MAMLLTGCRKPQKKLPEMTERQRQAMYDVVSKVLSQDPNSQYIVHKQLINGKYRTTGIEKVK